MTVAELIEALSNFDPNMQVWMSKDEEGNEYKPVGQPASFQTFELDPSEDGEDAEFIISLDQFNYADVADNPFVVMIWPGWYVQKTRR